MLMVEIDARNEQHGHKKAFFLKEINNLRQIHVDQSKVKTTTSEMGMYTISLCE